MTGLPAYSGTHATCPKCKARVSTRWHVMGGDVSSPCWRLVIGEHLCRACQNCGYSWIEACADSKGEPS
jgi:C4-type Zn-finger protein